ncbi:MAG: hypothetical protein IJN37_06590 [Clostridia bacterium]|nr:hypothetical protein [Clostridia bacterium]
MIYRTVNFELGMPAVSEIPKRLENEINLSKSYGVKVLKIIHGYGSSGKGGKIRTCLRRELDERLKKGSLKAVIHGEKFSIFDESTRGILYLDKAIRRDPDLDRANNGITLIVFK